MRNEFFPEKWYELVVFCTVIYCPFTHSFFNLIGISKVETKISWNPLERLKI